MKNFEYVVEKYKDIGIDVYEALERLSKIEISMNCWQGDDLTGFEYGDKELTGGIQSTGNYLGKPRTHEELMKDMELAFSLIPGSHRLNLHASYGKFDKATNRDEIAPENYDIWIEFAKKNNIKLDFNATFFSHDLANEGTLSAENDEVRKFWVNHAIAGLKVCEYIGRELNDTVLYNIWIPDGFKDIPADRFGPRERLKQSLDSIINTEYDKKYVNIAVESKVFGIGLESYTVGSHEFYMNYALKNNILCLLDNGHFHPTESIADKLSSLLLFNEKIALHITRAVRWDSDHVVRLNDEVKDIADEIIKLGEGNFLIGVDFFDGSINRVAAWCIGMRNVQKALLLGLLTPHKKLRELQEARDFTGLLAFSEDIKSLPFGEVWDKFCEENEVPNDLKWMKIIDSYEKETMSKRG